MKVEVKRDTNGVHIGITLDGCTQPFWFTNNEGPDGDNWDSMLVHHIFESLSHHVKYDREVLYDMGWHDAKSKKTKKKTGFNECFNSDADLAWEE